MPHSQIWDHFSDAFENNCGVGILRLQNGLDFSGMMSEHNVGDTQNLKLPEPAYPTNMDVAGSGVNLTDSTRQLSPDRESGAAGSQQLRLRNSTDRQGSLSSFAERLINAVSKNSRGSLNKSVNSDLGADVEAGEGDEKDGAEMKLLSDEMLSDQGEGDDRDDEAETPPDERPESPPRPPASYLRHRRMTKQQKEIMQIIDQFKTKVKKPVVHVYWLFDDGGKWRDGASLIGYQAIADSASNDHQTDISYDIEVTIHQ